MMAAAHKAPVDEPESNHHGLELRRLSDIAPQPVRWLWPGRIARGKVTLIAGHPGLGKSQLVLAVAAIVTTGGRWPVDGKRSERGSVVILSAEDDAADTIRPRLEADGADLTRCHIIDAVRDNGENGRQRRRGFSLADDLPRLDQALSEMPDCALVDIDPLTAYLGRIDSHRNTEVRAVLAPLAELAAKHGVAVVGVTHLRKNADGEAILQVSGSLGFVAAARAAFMVTRCSENGMRRLLLPLKNNIGDDRTGYAFQMEEVNLSGEIETTRIAWEPNAVTITADEAIASINEGSGSRATTARRRRQAGIADQFLIETLAEGPQSQREVEAHAEAAGLSWATVRRAAIRIGVIKSKIGFGDDGWWQWSLGDELPPEAEAPL